MDLTLKRYTRGRLDGTELWRGYQLEQITEEARELVEAGVADRVDVLDDDRKRLFRWPASLHCS